MLCRPGAPASRGGAAASARLQLVDAPPEELRSLGPGPVERGLSPLVEQLRARVQEGSLELERTHAEYERAHAELEAVNDELQRLLREQERLQAELAYRALHDPLTGLANRAMFVERLDEAFKVDPSSKIPPTSSVRVAESPSTVGGDTKQVDPAWAWPDRVSKATTVAQRQSSLMRLPLHRAATRAT